MSTQSQKLVEVVSQAEDAPNNQSVREEVTVEWGWKSPQAAVLAKRHSALVNKKFLEGLSPNEKKELEDIRAVFDQFDASFYAPIIETLTALAGKLSKENSQSEDRSMAVFQRRPTTPAVI